jgi:hypothetical protein
MGSFSMVTQKLSLDRRLTWHKHIFTKRKHLGTILTKLFWLLGRKSNLDLSNKLLICKVAIKPIWTYASNYGAQPPPQTSKLWNTFKALRLITDAPWYVPNAVIQNDLQIPTIKDSHKQARKQGGTSTHEKQRDERA